MYAVAIFLTYNLQFYVPYTLLWPRIHRKLLHKFPERTTAKLEHVFRIGLIIVTCKYTPGDRESLCLSSTSAPSTVG